MLTHQMPGISRQIRYLIAGSLIIVFGVVALVTWMICDAYRTARDTAIVSAANLAAAFEHDISRNFDAYDLSLGTIIDNLKAPGIWSLDPAFRDRFLFEGSTSTTYVGAFFVLDEHGNLIASSDPAATAAQTSFADRDFFRVHQAVPDKGAAPDKGLYISPPFKDPTGGAWSIALSRRIAHADGTFRGVAVGTMRLAYFQHLFDGIDFGPTGAVALLRDDKSIVLRKPFNEQDIGRKLTDVGFSGATPLQPDNVYQGVSTINGERRLFAYRQVDTFPLIISVGESEAAALAEWRHKTIIVGICVAGLIAVAGLFGYLSLAELKRRSLADRRVDESEFRYKLLADNATDMIVVASIDGTLLYASPAARAIYGYDPDEIVGKRIGAGMHPDDYAGAIENIGRLLAGERHVTMVSRGRRKDGSFVWTEGNARLVRDPMTGTESIISVVRDISERKAAEEALERARDEAEAASRAKSKFLANMSHELRTPLNAVIGFSEVIEREMFGPLGSERYREYATDIRDSGQHLLEMITEILDHAKAEAAHLVLDEDDVDIGQVVDFATRMLAPRADRAGILIGTDVTPDILVHGDERRLRQIVLNLLTNAIKFTPAGGRIIVSAGLTPDGGLTLAVEDNGVGIAEADQAQLFEPFHAAASPQSNQEGTGLGLPLTKRLVELHGGSLALSSSLGVGTTIRIDFPASRVKTATPRAGAPRPVAENEAARRS